MDILAALSDRLLDNDKNVCKEVVAVLCDVACCSLNSVSVETIKLVAERLTDKSVYFTSSTFLVLSFQFQPVRDC